jgi:hypothetical protein
MDSIINQIHEIIKDYRRDDLGFSYRTEMTPEHIKKWIEQFDKDDQEFLLIELLHILPKSYLSKERILKMISEEFDVYVKDFGYSTVQGFFEETRFLKCQPQHKSQTILLSFTNEIIKDLYGMSVDECGQGNVKNWLYVDDVLASGKTFKDDILEEIENHGNENFKNSGIRIISSSFILHSWGAKNVRFALSQNLGYKLESRLNFYRFSEIDNNPYIHRYYNPYPKFNHVYPKESDIGKEALEFIENSFERDYPMKNEKYAFRESKYPLEEKFYSSAQNRDRYEQILLKKGLDIMYSIENLQAKSLRPLGMTPPSWKTLGTGSHFFTWRNISNTCPIVFWWGVNDWYPLFPVKNRGSN